MISRPAALRALIVDDEPVARRVLREELETLAGVLVAGEAADGPRALQAIAELKPDLVFLDLQMPEMTGFEVIRRLPARSHLPVFIIVTAFDRYAIQAFDAGAVDYLLKPVRQQRLEQSLSRARQLLRSPLRTAETVARLHDIAARAPDTAAPFVADAKASGQKLAGKIVGKLGGEYFLLDVDEVMAFQADGDLVWIVTEKHRYLGAETLRDVERKLAGSGFRRVHRSVVVNVHHIRKMSPLSSQRWLLTMKNQQEFIVSKRLAAKVREILD
jgi:two-component system, LytTR family, response regulator